MAGVLAGFAFVVINLVLDRGYRRRGDGKPRGASEVEHETLTSVALMNAFLGLFLSAIQYSLLAGENGCSLTGGRAASAELLGGDARQTLRIHCRSTGTDRGVLHRGDDFRPGAGPR